MLVKRHRSGWDFNARLTGSFNFGDVIWLNAATMSTERQVQIFAGDTIDELKGTYGNPETRYNSNVIVNMGENWSFSWLARFVGETTAHGCEPNVTGCGCDNYEVRPDLLVTTEPTAGVCDAASIWYHDISATYAQDTWNVTAGIQNLPDEQPPLITRGTGSNPNESRYLIRLRSVRSAGVCQLQQGILIN